MRFKITPKEYALGFKIKRSILLPTFVCIDPGVGCGFAEFEKKKLIRWKTVYGKGNDWKEKYADIGDKLRNDLYGQHTVFIEWPSFQNAASQNTGSIIKLAYLIGKLSMLNPNTKLIPVTTWKGSLSKELTQKRAEKFFGQKGFTSHAADAVALGQYVLQAGLV